MPTIFERHFRERGEFKNLEFGLHRIQAAADELGLSDNIAKNVIHIAGTNGKGSTALFIEQILRHRGQTTALFTSPHIHTIRERIRLNGQNISQTDFDSVTSELIPVIDRHTLTYFEALTLIALKYFRDAHPDTAVIETGLGGRLDSTNILNRKLPVITSISIDHTEYLGSDIFGIADEKLAIIKDNPVFFLGQNTEEITSYIYNKVTDKKIIRPDYSDAPYHGFDRPYSNNLRLAESVCGHIVPGGLPSGLKLPMCRMERFGRFILEGAHNEAGLKLLAEKFRGQRPTAVFSCTRDRDFQKLYNILSDFCENIVVTQIPENDRSIDITTLNPSLFMTKSPEEALKLAVELSENADILVCGSLYLCAYIREILTKGNV
ncbi:MAG: folylpolyglutamate synthase/dihydrofolate synthase family protein [Deferribacterales bacterium]